MFQLSKIVRFSAQRGPWHVASLNTPLLLCVGQIDDVRLTTQFVVNAMTHDPTLTSRSHPRHTRRKPHHTCDEMVGGVDRRHAPV